jgi:NitT/TauT family transport system substrate-binding protein
VEFFLKRLIHLLLFLVATAFGNVYSAERIVISAPGPRNISYLPVDLISKIGTDKAEGVELQVIHTGGGAVALKNLVTRNADFAVAGMPAAMSLRANGGDVVTIAAVNDAPLFVLMVRSELKTRVKRIADLKGMVIGVNTSTRNSKTTSQQLAELLLTSGGVALDSVRIVPAGQSWVEQSSLILSGTVDAVMGDEPFASRLQKDGKVFFLVNLAEPETTSAIKGANFLHAALETRSDILANEPYKAEKMVRILRNTLQWMRKHSAEEIVDRLDIKDTDERRSLIDALKKYPNAFSVEGKLSTTQLKETELFFQTTSAGDPRAGAMRIEQMVNDRWSGRAP